jgi:hypothetical protein
MFSKTKKIKHRSSGDASTADKLPAGAEAALWSIVEVIPDPRNHLALTKDPTAEVRLTRAAIDEAVALAAAPEPAELPPVPDPEPALPIRRPGGVRWSADTAEVRLPTLNGPHTGGGASVHAIDPAGGTPAAEQPVPRRYARGA